MDMTSKITNDDGRTEQYVNIDTDHIDTSDVPEHQHSTYRNVDGLNRFLDLHRYSDHYEVRNGNEIIKSGEIDISVAVYDEEGDYVPPEDAEEPYEIFSTEILPDILGFKHSSILRNYYYSARVDDDGRYIIQMDSQTGDGDSFEMCISGGDSDDD